MRIYFDLAQMCQAQSGRSEGMRVDGPTFWIVHQKTKGPNFYQSGRSNSFRLFNRPL